MPARTLGSHRRRGNAGSLRALSYLPRATASSTIDPGHCAADLSCESERALEVALQLYRDGSADFADCLHVALAAQAAALPLWTFDKRTAKVTGAQAIGR